MKGKDGSVFKDEGKGKGFCPHAVFVILKRCGWVWNEK